MNRARSIALTLGGIAASQPRRARAQEVLRVSVSGAPIDDFKVVQYAIVSGLFRRYGVEVEVTWVNSGAAGLAAVAGGAVNVAFTSLPGLLQAYLRGLPFRIVAPGALYLSEAATNALYVKRGSPIRSGRDLNGKTVAVQAIKDLNWVVTMAWIDQNGGDSSTVKVIELPFPAVAPALAEGRVDAGNITSPFNDQAVAAGQIQLLGKSYDSIAKRYQSNVFVATVDYVNANQEAMRRWVRAMHDSIVYVNAHLPETVDLVAAFTKADPAVIARSVRAIDPEYLDPRDIQPVIDVAFKYKMIERAFRAEEIISPVALRATR
jgi:NitT/TauT family transport system substrate-binding protein